MPNTLHPRSPSKIQKVGIQPNERVYLAASEGPCQCRLSVTFQLSSSVEQKARSNLKIHCVCAYERRNIRDKMN